MSGFTPGSLAVWSSLYEGYSSCVVVKGSDPLRTLAQVRSYHDAMLYAAAPDLLEALRSAADFIEDEAESRSAAGSRYSDYEGGPRDLLERIDAAISKATGEAK